MKIILCKVILFILATVFLMTTGFIPEYTIADSFKSDHATDSFLLNPNDERLVQSNDPREIKKVIGDMAVTTGAAMEMSSLTLKSMQTEGAEVLECTSATWSGGGSRLRNPPQGQVGIGFDDSYSAYNSYMSSWATWNCPESLINKIDTLYAVSIQFKFREVVNSPYMRLLLGNGPTPYYGVTGYNIRMSYCQENTTCSMDITEAFNTWLNGSTYGRSVNVISFRFEVDQFSESGIRQAFWDMEDFNIIIEYKPVNNEPTLSYTTPQPAVTNIVQSASWFYGNSYNSTNIVAGAYEDDYDYYSLSTDFGITLSQFVLDNIKILKSATLKIYFSDNRSGYVYIYSISGASYPTVFSGNPGISSGWYTMDITKILALWLNRRGTETEHRFHTSASQIYDWYEGFVKVEGSHDTLYARMELEYVPHNYIPDAPTSLSPDCGSIINSSDSFSFYYSDYDGDTMSICRFRYRIQGAPEWITTEEIHASALNGTSVTYTFPSETFLNGTTYEWQAASFDGALWSDWSQTAVFVTNSPPTIPAVLVPNTLLTTINASVSNDFSFVYLDPNEQTMKQYQIRYKFLEETEWTMMQVVQKPMENGAGCICAIASNTFIAGQSYAWQVRANDGFLWSDWSDSALFKTNTQPDKPTMLNPDTDTITVDPTVSNSLSFLYSDIDLHDMSKCQIRFKVLPEGNWTESSVNTVLYPSNSTVIYDLPANILVRDNTYEWQARVFDGRVWSDWSSIANFVTTDVTAAGAAKHVAIQAVDITGTVNKYYTVTYDPSFYKLSDVCIFTGHPSDHGINVILVDEISGIIRFTVLKEVEPGKMWTGLVNILRFVTLVDNNMTINVVKE